MDEQTKKLITEYLGKLLAAMERGADFAIEQAPLIVQEKLTYDFAMAIAGVALGIAMIAASYGWYRFWHARAVINQTASGYTGAALQQRIFEDGNNGLGLIIGAIVTFIAVGFVIPLNLITALHIHFAPRLYIIEWLRSGL